MTAAGISVWLMIQGGMAEGKHDRNLAAETSQGSNHFSVEVAINTDISGSS
jgi:hypothetical protein